jgi:aspartate/methionine/tyrosine aminotransferase
MGLPALRQAVAAHLGRTGLPTREEQILITNGAQQAISLVSGIAGGARRGRGHRGSDVHRCHRRAGVGGRARAGLAGRCPGPRPRPFAIALGHATAPALRGADLSQSHGRPHARAHPPEIARIADELQVPVVEDNTLAGIVLGGEPPPPIAAFAKNAPILTLGSLSKLFWAGLRVGYIRGPEAWIVRLGRFKALSDLGGPLVSQAIAALLLDQAEAAAKTRRREVTTKLDC